MTRLSEAWETGHDLETCVIPAYVAVSDSVIFTTSLFLYIVQKIRWNSPLVFKFLHDKVGL